LAEHKKLISGADSSFVGSLSGPADPALTLAPSRCERPQKRKSAPSPALFGIVQGGRYKDLREKSARVIGVMDFDGFGIGGSFVKKDMSTAVKWVNEILPENKPRHLLGIGEPEDLFMGVENGADLFDCVTPTRNARNGTLYTKNGKINITNAKFRNDFKPIENLCICYTCKNFSRAYIAHLFHGKEMLAATLASIHNLYFIINLVKKIRQSILDDNFFEFKKKFLKEYLK
jgi:queuine tRNA-ribosyltransferase